MNRLLLYIAMASAASMPVSGAGAFGTEEVRDSVRIFFQQGKIEFVPGLKGNKDAVRSVADSIRSRRERPDLVLRSFEVEGAASPEGSERFNRWLSEKRAEVILNRVCGLTELPDSLRSTSFRGRDWHGLIALVEADQSVPYRDEVLPLLRAFAADVAIGARPARDHVATLKALRGGVPYRYMYRRMFPELRASWIKLRYDRVKPVSTGEPPVAEAVAAAPDTVYVDRIVTVRDTVCYCPPCRPFYMGIKTDMLRDVLLVPNIGVEFYLGRNLSLGANWMYGWWNNDRRHRYWRVYGGDAELRWWFGSAAHGKPLTGHHLGLYGQIFTYDFELGGKGYMGGKPGGNLWERANYGVGVSYGYALPISRRFNIDFVVGFGYQGGKFEKYRPEGNCYVWQSTRRRHYFGPAKAEISLVWLIGCDNYNRQRKGGKR